MDRYTKVEQKKPDIPINENEIRITSQGLVRNYISYAATLLQERRGKEIVLKAMGQAISKTVAIAEIIKRNIPRLHQDTGISSISITDVWEPIEEGLLPVEMTRQVSMISITLSTKELNKNSPGYQAPLYVERPRQQYNNYQRHQQQPRVTPQSYNEEPYGGNYHGNRGRSQGGGVRGRGWNRGGGYANQGGGYGSYQGGDGYRNYQGGGGYGNNYQSSRGNGYYGGGRGYGNYQSGGGGGDFGKYQDNNGYSNRGRGGGRGGEYGNYQDHNGYSNRGRGGGRGGDYGNYQDNNGYSNRGRGSGGNAGYRGSGYMRGGGGRFNGRGRGRMD